MLFITGFIIAACLSAVVVPQLRVRRYWWQLASIGIFVGGLTIGKWTLCSQTLVRLNSFHLHKPPIVALGVAVVVGRQNIPFLDPLRRPGVFEHRQGAMTQGIVFVLLYQQCCGLEMDFEKSW